MNGWLPSSCRCGWQICRRSGPSTTCGASRYNWMFQYYLRAAGLALSWVGTGRLIFSLNYTDADFAAVADRILSAARDMQRDGWWWSDAQLTNKSIRRRVFKEMLQARWARLDVAHGVDQLAAHQVERRLPVGLHVVERVGEDLGQPHESGLHVLQKEQVHGAEQQRTDADDEPDLADVAHEFRARRWAAQTGRRTSDPATAAAGDNAQTACRITLRRRLYPTLMSSLYSWRRPIDLVVTLRLEEEVTGLAADHGHQPADQRGLRRIGERGHVGDDEADRRSTNAGTG